jgi:hypothetical protein
MVAPVSATSRWRIDRWHGAQERRARALRVEIRVQAGRGTLESRDHDVVGANGERDQLRLNRPDVADLVRQYTGAALAGQGTIDQLDRPAARFGERLLEPSRIADAVWQIRAGRHRVAERQVEQLGWGAWTCLALGRLDRDRCEQHGQRQEGRCQNANET